jgi:hypothetical protein
MTMNTNRTKLALILPGLGAVAVLAVATGIVAYARLAQAAAGIHTPASICRPKNYNQGKDFSYNSGAVVRNENPTLGTTKELNCPVMTDIAGIGDLVVNVMGIDNSTTGSVSCTIVTTNSSNNQVWTASVSSFSTVTQTGAFNKAFTTGPTNDHDFYRTYVNCSIPNRVGTSRSGLYGFRVQ